MTKQRLPRWKVVLGAVSYATATVIVRASSREEAEAMAHATPAYWNYHGLHDQEILETQEVHDA